ncbi:hypothetical protein GmHk_13G036259 [Glycine max]|nr:hypothetical protein GmHk_13G036259 [Glycine max]
MEAKLNSLWQYNVLGRNILSKRKVEIYHTKLDEFKTELERRNFHKRLTNLVNGSIDLALVKEFYSNLYSSEDRPPKQSRVRGHLVKIDADNLNTFLETPMVLAEGEALPAYSRYCKLPTDYREIKATLSIPGRGFVLNFEGRPGKILRKDLTTLVQVWSVLSYSNLPPTSHTSDLTVERARLISGQMTSIAQSNTSRLGFSTLITALCRARGVVSDSLTFECLSPVINLAYIRKNYWNPEDRTVSIRVVRRVRARPAELPSTFAAPTLASTSVASSVPAQIDSQRFEAMLKSIHQGQIILLQSLQVVAPPGSIPSIEQFREMVAWPGTRPSLHREDEGPTAQVAAATLKRSLEATSEPPASAADLPSPQHAIDPSTLVLEIPEDQTTPVLTLDTSPPATPVLQLTDEEDVQTQDTQNQSQEF